MSLAQDLRNVYYARGNDAFEALVKKIEQLELLAESRRKALAEHVPRLATLHYGDQCQCAPTPTKLVGAPGEPLRCAECCKPVTFLSTAIGQPMVMSGVAGLANPVQPIFAPQGGVGGITCGSSGG
jgi:hypothetical protein